MSVHEVLITCFAEFFIPIGVVALLLLLYLLPGMYQNRQLTELGAAGAHYSARYLMLTVRLAARHRHQRKVWKLVLFSLFLIYPKVNCSTTLHVA